MYHGKIWHSEFPSPMTSYGSQKHVFVNDFVLFSSDVLGQTTGKVKEIFREEGTMFNAFTYTYYHVQPHYYIFQVLQKSN